MSTPGTPAWVEAPTSDLAASRDFYSRLFGWTFEIDPDVGYSMALKDGKFVAGLYEPGEPAPPAWTLYLNTADINVTARQVADLSGQNLVGPMEIPGQGHALVSTDPTGGVIGFWQATGADRGFAMGVPGAFGWAELNTRDGDTADKFFSSLFGYDQEQIGDGTNFDYTVWSLGGEQQVGRMRMGDEFPAEIPSHWMVYFVADPEKGTDAVADRVAELGGKICVPAFGSAYGRISVVEDQVGNTFSLVDPTVTEQ